MINEKRYDLSDKERFNNNIIEFTYFAKKVLPQLKTLKKQIENFKGFKESSILNNKILLTLLDKYEELNLNCYVENQSERLVLGDPKNKELKDRMEKMIANLRNPF